MLYLLFMCEEVQLTLLFALSAISQASSQVVNFSF